MVGAPLLLVLLIIIAIFVIPWVASKKASELVMGDRMHTVRGRAFGWFLAVGIFILVMMGISSWGNSLLHH